MYNQFQHEMKSTPVNISQRQTIQPKNCHLQSGTSSGLALLERVLHHNGRADDAAGRDGRRPDVDGARHAVARRRLGRVAPWRPRRHDGADAVTASSAAWRRLVVRVRLALHRLLEVGEHLGWNRSDYSNYSFIVENRNKELDAFSNFSYKSTLLMKFQNKK